MTERCDTILLDIETSNLSPHTKVVDRHCGGGVFEVIANTAHSDFDDVN